MTDHDDPTARPRLESGRELDRSIELTRRQLDELEQSTGKLGRGTKIEEALAALSVTLEELEVTAEELRAQNDELVETRGQAERERRRAQQLFDMAPEPCLVTDLTGAIQAANRQAERALGRHVGELDGKPLPVLVHASDRTPVRVLLRNIEDGPVRNISVRIEPRDRPARRMALSVRRTTDVDGSPRLLWQLTDGALHDAARSQLQRDADRATSPAEDVRRWQATLLGASAHDLRTPLQVIGGSIETLLEHWGQLDADSGRAILEAAQAQTAKLGRVLQTLMDVSRLGLQSDRVQRERVTLRDLVDRVVTDTGADQEHQVLVDVDSDLVVLVDPDQTERIVGNLVGNALAHTPAGTTITVRATTDADAPSTLELVVEDDGPGVPDEMTDLVFEPFASLDRDARGSGLGLAIVAMFAAFHGGDARVGRAVSGGARFTVRLADAVPG